MLSYKPPFIQSGNLTIFSDDVNPDVFYYACVEPNIIINTEGTPQIEAYAIIPESGLGERESIMEAGIMMDIDLSPGEEALQDARKAINKIYGKPPKQLVPAPIHDGKVKMIMANAGEEPDPTKWYISPEINSSVMGDNNAALVAKTTGENAKLLIAALNSEVVAASIHYSLNMLGTAPVFNARMKVDWKKVYHHFEKFEKENFIFYTDEITETIDELKETSAIEIQIEELDPDIKAEALKSMLNELKTEVFKKIFDPAPSPLSAGEKTEDRIAAGVSRVLASVAIGGHHILRNIHEEQLITSEINLSQKNAKLYPYYPQSLLISMIRRAGGIKDKIKWIKLDEIPFIDQSVEVNLPADSFTDTNIKSVLLNCRVLKKGFDEEVASQSLVFDAPEKTKAVFNFTREKNVDYVYKYKATVFIKTEGSNLPDKLELDWKEENSSFIYFNPELYFKTYTLSLNLDDTAIFSTAHLIEIFVECFDVKEDLPVLQKTFLLDGANFSQKNFSIVAGKNIELKFRLTTTYFLKESTEHKAIFEDVPEGFFFIPNPFENKWSVDIFCHADWASTHKLILETRITDAEREDLILNKFNFTSETGDTKISVNTSLKTPKEKFDYRITTISNDGNIIQGPWQNHEGPALAITDKIAAERILRATLVSCPDFEKMEIKIVSIEFVYEDSENNILVESGRLPFEKIGDTVTFKHPMPNFNHKQFKHMERVRSKTGKSYKTNWETDITDNIEIHIPDKIW